ncbi:MAG TPA: isochorismate synthase [Polyangiaceae bacterium]|jgi:isochorismate synthase|nr:isochorismate synthase [Polyangiaceae bacterium]
MTTSAVSVTLQEPPLDPVEFIRAALEANKARSAGTVVVTVPAPSVALETVLDAAAEESAVLWSPPEGPGFVALGSVETFVGTGVLRTEQIRSRAEAFFARLEHVRSTEDAPSLRCFGGLSFQPGAASAEPWTEFGDARFVFPRFRYCRQGDRGFLSVAARADETASEPSRRALVAAASGLLDALHRASRVVPTAVRPEARRVVSRDETSETEYRGLVQRIVDRIGAGEFQKVVIARRSTLSFDAPVEPTSVLRDLAETSEHCTRFAFRFGKMTFVGATPERLIRRRGPSLDTEALAGSSDGAQAAALMHSPKEREEHDLVVREIVRALAPLCVTLDHPTAPEVRVLRHLLHLTTPIRGRLSAPVHVLDLVQRLHPTPAVGGVPGPDAVRFITEHEPAERGWYASPIGWFDADGDGEFAVGLRSGALVGDRAYLYAGGGIVKDSDPASEYAETRLKLATLSAALHVAQ